LVFYFWSLLGDFGWFWGIVSDLFANRCQHFFLFFMSNATRVTIAPELVRGVPHWRVRFYDVVTQRVRRRFFSSVAAAEKFAGVLQRQDRDAEGVWARLLPAERSLLIAVWREAQLRGVDLLAAVVHGAPVKTAGPTLGVVIGELIVSKREAGRNRLYLARLENLLNRFAAGREAKPIAAVEVAVVEEFMRPMALRYRATVRARLSTLFNFAVRRRYRPDNPLAQLEPVKLVAPLPRVFTLSELKLALAWVKSPAGQALGPWLVLSTFCGLRPDEAASVGREQINFKEGWIKVEAATSKVRQRRVVYPRPEAMRLLAAVVRPVPNEIRLPASTRRRVLRRLREHLGWAAWPKDVTRHTAASLWLAVEPDVAKVAAMLGNSPGVLLKHYKAVMTKAEAVRMWKLINHG